MAQCCPARLACSWHWYGCLMFQDIDSHFCLCSEFNNIAKNPELDLYPEDLRSAIDEVNSWVYPTINNGVYRSGFATSQKAYETAFK